MGFILIAEDGPFAGEQIVLEGHDEFIFGRDIDSCFKTLEDPSVSRNHAKFSILEDQCFLENLSETNPTVLQGKTFEEKVLLHQDDIIQIGTTFFRFTIEEPNKDDQTQDSLAQTLLSNLTNPNPGSYAWLIKVITGPNRGAEFALQKDKAYVLGKDAALSDLIFQDHSVSKKHAKITVTQEGKVSIEDLSSLNGIWVNNEKIEEQKELSSQDVLSLGTTSFILLDRSANLETIAAVSGPPGELFGGQDLAQEQDKLHGAKNLKDLFIPTKHLALASIFGLFILFVTISMLALFRSQTVSVVQIDHTKAIEKMLKPFKHVTFNYNKNSAKLFVMGHVLTDVEYNKLIYLLKNANYIKDIQDNVIVDEGVWESTNTLLSKNPAWKSALVMAYDPGSFILQGYVQTQEIANELFEFVTLNFPYVSLLKNEIIVTDNLYIKIKNILFEKNLYSVNMQGSNGTITLNGRIATPQEKILKGAMQEIEKLKGTKAIKNFVLVTGKSTLSINLSSKYKVSGVTKLGNINQFVLINGKILSKGDMLDGMTIQQITMNTILLTRDGLKYKIDYNS